MMTTNGVEPVVSRWLDRLSKRRGVSRTTITTYRSVMRNLTRWNGGMPVLYLAAEDLGRWVDHLAVDGLDAGTRRTYIGVAAQFYAWAISEDLVTVDPAAGLDRPRGRRRLPRPMPENDLEAALQLTVDAEIRAMIALGAFAALRAQPTRLSQPPAGPSTSPLEADRDHIIPRCTPRAYSR